MSENVVSGSGDNASFSIHVRKAASQYLKIGGDAFALKLTRPGAGLTIRATSYKKRL